MLMLRFNIKDICDTSNDDARTSGVSIESVTDRSLRIRLDHVRETFLGVRMSVRHAQGYHDLTVAQEVRMSVRHAQCATILIIMTFSFIEYCTLNKVFFFYSNDTHGSA